MLKVLWLVPALPLATFFLLAVAGARMPRRMTAIIGVGSVGLSAILTILIGLEFINTPPPDFRFTQTLWTWMLVGDFRADFGLHLDALSLVMIFVVTFVGYFIHFYSTDFMHDDDGFSRFFAYMNLFVASMLILVLADNLLFLLLGWEGVGLCSYLLIGFWYRNSENGKAAIKAFVVTRIGDVAFLIALFVIFTSLATLDIREAMERAGLQWTPNSAVALWAALLLLIGAIGKSAQLPLQVWLPDAMAGPTPVSALIHAATMVAAGVYLVARMNGLFVLAPSIQQLILILAIATVLMAGCSALVQEDLKRVLAYSTISQMGYMFLALGAGAWAAAIFHFLTHAFFKALLFLCAGVVILAVHHETSIFKMGGLRNKIPLVFWTFLIGALTTSGIPPTAGFASKDLIMYSVWNLPNGGPILWGAALLGVFITSLYSFRMLFLVFFRETKAEPARRAGFYMGMPLAVLATFCFLTAVLDWPHAFFGSPILSNFLASSFPPMPASQPSVSVESITGAVSVAAGILGIFAAWLFFLAKREYVNAIISTRAGSLVHRFWFSGWGFDWLYERVFIRPYVRATRRNRNDVIDRFYDGVAAVMENVHGLLSLTQNGNLRWYAMSIVIGAIVFLAVIIFS
ncbi:MAG: NADH-quinone oxidoreductase subunit L [Candidatus Abyssobacteria bacterium SURF_5]|uniref:NADH-quinone oxidoreductase subunit L n=1 Tax=Abyssobacteria bacterium (strain SURF_5) TaxID=2093360 RepID=A0A3A4N6J4_ABYX5|nr:MAG: NADH-quinone oxidoreductase subunit L [Candidatus Abyssubacteria bacterium SURF_5]